MCRSLWRNTRYYLGLSPNEPQDLYPSTLRRSRILNTIERDHRLQANFIRHNKYRAGANTPEERQNSTLAFYDNMVQSDYIISVRGGGNFSVRLYETLAMGRIPVFVNTDCLLPLPEKINWEKHVIWAEPGDIPHITQKILEFHEQLSPTDFLSLQQENRKLWKQFLTLGEYFKHQINAL
nr:exostosin family protein [Lewinellaceae bacterium]